MIQTLDIITINIWSILISLANLVILFFILKRFLYKPLQNILAQRKASIDSQYEEADNAKISAQENERLWQEKMQGADEIAKIITQEACQRAENRSEAIITEADEKAREIIRRAENEADAIRIKAEAEIKTQIADVSAALAEKLLEREINSDDHTLLIESFINEVGDDHGGNA